MSTDNGCKSFNETLRKLFDTFAAAATGIKTSLGLSQMREKMIKTISAQEAYAITVLGPFIWNRRKEINDGDSKHFLERKYDVTLMSLSQLHKFSYKDAVACVEFMKNVFKNTTEVNKTTITNLVKELLASYVKYVKSCKVDKTQS